MPKLSLAKLERHLYSAADRLRQEGLDAATYKDYIFGLLFLVPERARWSYLQTKLADATEPYGSMLDKALGALSEANESLEHVLDHISFMRVQSNKRIVSDDAYK